MLWPVIRPIAGEARRRYTILAADACYWLPLPGNLSPCSHSRRLSFLQQPAPHYTPLAEEWELVGGGATALTLATVSRDKSFDRAAVLLQSTPHPSPLPKEREPVMTNTPPSN